MSIARAFLCFSFSLLLAGSANASTIFTDLSPTGDLFFSGAAFVIHGTAELAARFVVNQDSPETQFDLALGADHPEDTLTITLRADNGGLPGTILDTFVVTNLPTFGTCCSLSSLTSTQFLTNGTSYWLVVSPNDANKEGFWFINNTDTKGLQAFNQGSGFVANTDFLGAFDVLAIPEPASVILVAGGIGLTLIRRRFVR